MIKNLEIIAEVKTQSPFGFNSQYSWQELFDAANEIGDIISIHIDAGWGGTPYLLAMARKLTSKPILAKGFHLTDDEVKESIDLGADYVLIVGRVPQRNLERCFIEPTRLSSLHEVPEGSRVIWNARDLITGEKKHETFKQAREIWKGWLCQASYIRTVHEIKEGANAVLVGSYLKEFAESLAQHKY